MPAVTPLATGTPARRPRSAARAALVAATSVLLLLLCSTAAAAAQTTLAWDKNTDSDLAGYKVYVGDASGIYQTSIAVGLSPSYLVTALQAGRVYYFAVTAVNASGSESGLSTEVSAAIPALPLPVPPGLSATLAWDQNTDSDLAGYKVYVGEASGIYQRSTAVGLSPSYLVTGLQAGRVYYFAVTAINASGSESGLSAEVSTAIPALPVPQVDGEPPVVAVIAPVGGVTVSGSVVLAANASDNFGVAGVRFAVDGKAVGAELTGASYTMPWDTFDVSDGAHTVTAVARDAAGNITTSAGIRVTVTNGVLRLTPQDTSLNLDANNYSAATVLTTYTWPAHQVANAIVMKFDVSSIPAGALVQAATLHLALLESDGALESGYTVSAHKLVGLNPVIAKATGYTADGKKTWTPSSCCYNGIPLAQSNLSGAYDTRALDKTVGDKTWTITAMVQDWLAAPSTNFGLLLNADITAPADRYRYFASTEHLNADLRPFLQITYAAPPAVDTVAPSVSLTTPAATATLAGTTTIRAGATDNVGVAAVQFTLDGAALGAERTAAPYTLSWNTAGANDGPHQLAAIARDAAGNRTTSAALRVTVMNGVMRLTPEDTSLNIDTTNYSAHPQLATYTWPDNQRANAIIMKFDLSTLPPGAVVQEATLQLTLLESDRAPEGFYTVSAHKIVGVNPVIDQATGYTADGATAWTASACCANDTPLAQGDITPAYDVRAVDKTPGAKAWTLTSMAREWLADPAANFGVLLNADASALADRYRYFASMEHATASFRPVLSIRYMVP